MAEEDEAKPASYQKAGSWLREARIAADMTVPQVASALKMSPRQIDALERDDYAELPGGMFLRGFVRNYAKLLKLEPESLVGLLDPQAPRHEERRLPSTDFKEVPFEQGDTNWSRFVVVTTAVLALVLAAAYWIERHWQPGDLRLDMPAASTTSSAVQEWTLPAASSATALSTLPGVLLPVELPHQALSLVSMTPAATPDASSAKNIEPALIQEFGARDGVATLDFVFDAESWVDIRDKSGNRLVSQLMTPGSRPRVRGTPPFKLVIGNARKVKLTYQGKEVDLTLGLQSGDVARVTLD